jgi:4-hydroxyacetophenone monooxygenase
VFEIMQFCAGEQIDPAYLPLVREECQFAGVDPRRFAWETMPPRERLDAFRVGIIGSGFGGLCAAIRLQQAGIPYTIYEKNDDIGGTWYENDFPDLRVDVPNHFYSYSFEPNPDWSSFFARRDELKAYIDGSRASTSCSRTCAAHRGRVRALGRSARDLERAAARRRRQRGRRRACAR